MGGGVAVTKRGIERTAYKQVLRRQLLPIGRGRRPVRHSDVLEALVCCGIEEGVSRDRSSSRWVVKRGDRALEARRDGSIAKWVVGGEVEGQFGRSLIFRRRRGTRVSAKISELAIRNLLAKRPLACKVTTVMG
jgi:hypothetical protein